MLDDLESNIIKEEKSESTSNKFPLSRFSLPVSQQNVNILSMSTSKRFIYLVTDRSELLRIESESLKLLQQAFNIDPPQTPPKFYENLTKIWTDREGNHSIIRYNKGIYYFNSSGSFVKELKSLYGIEVCAVGFDDSNKDIKSTGNFLVTDYLNNIYECNITTDKYNSVNTGDGFCMECDMHLNPIADELITLSGMSMANDDPCTVIVGLGRYDKYADPLNTEGDYDLEKAYHVYLVIFQPIFRQKVYYYMNGELYDYWPFEGSKDN